MEASKKYFELGSVGAEEACEEDKDELVVGFVTVVSHEGSLFLGGLEAEVEGNQVLLEGEVEKIVVISLSAGFFKDACFQEGGAKEELDFVMGNKEFSSLKSDMCNFS